MPNLSEVFENPIGIIMVKQFSYLRVLQVTGPKIVYASQEVKVVQNYIV